MPHPSMPGPRHCKPCAASRWQAGLRLPGGYASQPLPSPSSSFLRLQPSASPLSPSPPPLFSASAPFPTYASPSVVPLPARFLFEGALPATISIAAFDLQSLVAAPNPHSPQAPSALHWRWWWWWWRSSPLYLDLACCWRSPSVKGIKEGISGQWRLGPKEYFAWTKDATTMQHSEQAEVVRGGHGSNLIGGCAHIQFMVHANCR